jgi:hypothetical protein
VAADLLTCGQDGGKEQIYLAILWQADLMTCLAGWRKGTNLPRYTVAGGLADLLGIMKENRFTSLYCGGGLADLLGRMKERSEFTSLYCGGGLADSLGGMEDDRMTWMARSKFALYKNFFLY